MDMYVETSKKSGLSRIWTDEEIKGAFNLGNGTIKDFENYMKNNKQFCTFKKLF